MLRNAFEGLSTEAKQDLIITAIGSLLTELGQKLEAGQAVALDAGTLAALESITATVANFPVDFPDSALLAKAEAIRALLAGTLAISASALPLPAGAATDAKLDSILSALISAAVGIYPEDSAHVSGDMGRLVFGIRWDSDTPTAGDGDYTALKLDEAGRLKVATQPASVSPVSGSITANGQSVAIECKRFANLSFSMVATSLVGHNISFEASNNSTNGTDGNWYGVQAVRSNANTVEATSGVLAATPAYMWHISVGDYSWFRVRATAHTSGTAAYILHPGVFATEPVPSAQVTGTQPVSGTVTSNVGTSGLTTYTDSSSNLGVSAAFTGTSRDGGSTPAYNLFVASAFADQAGTLEIQKSTDGTTWRRAASVAVALGEGKELAVRCTARYYRVVYTNGGVAQAQFLLTSAYQRI